MAEHNSVRYLWYITTTPPDGEDRCYYCNGQWFGAYRNELDPDFIDQYNMRYVGMGNESFPETYNLSHV